ncbi:MAG: hypothetical protein KAT69_04945, partial [Candidatus Aminicenantes bacterium]|nr:hypothetical protein [Candidatus Aminicenantes bacterium]
RSIQQTSDGGYILAGGTNFFPLEEEILIIKLTPTGDVEWQWTYGGNQRDRACSIQQTSDGGYVLAGNTRSFGAGGENIWIVKLSTLGDIEWQQAYGGTGDDSVSSIQQTVDGGYVIGGATSSFGGGGADVLVIKLSQAGDIEWQKTFGTSSEEVSYTLRQTSEGGYIAAGSISSYGSGYSDFLAIKLLSDGNIDSSCRFLQDSSVQISITTVSPRDLPIVTRSSDIILEPINPSMGVYDSDAIEYELCSGNPLLAVHATSGGTTDPPPGTSIRVLGEEVTLTALPESGLFTGWSGDISDENDQITVTMIEDTSVSANFTFVEYTLIIQSGEGGTTIPEPGAYDYPSGTNIPVTAVPESGYEFSEWSGDVLGTDNPVRISLDSDKSITASFIQVSGEDDVDDSLTKIFRMNCAIATAAYESPSHPHVQALRDFRDEYLMRSKFGRSFVDLYYRYSPRIADSISKHKLLKAAVRLHLLPLVAFSFSMVSLGPVMTAVLVLFIFGFPALFGVILRKRTTKEFKRISC